MRMSLIETTLKALINRGRTTCMEGAPGCGKTTIIGAVTRRLGLHYIERHLPTMPVEDFGIPDVMSDGPSFGYKMPEWYPYKGHPVYDDGRGGVLCFDDRNQAGNDLQKVLANLCQARNLHGVPLADGWTIVSTGNRQEDRAGANRVLSHLRDRETVITLEPHLDDWCSYALEHGVNPMVVTYLRWRPGNLHNMDPANDIGASPRSWTEGVSPNIGLVPAEAEMEVFAGDVGEGIAAEFVGFMRIYRNLPNIDNVLLNPDVATVPEDVQTKYALAGAIAERATNANFDRVCRYADRMGDDFSVLAVSYAARKNAEVMDTKAFTQWSLDHQNVLF